jgi:uncharacterized protein (DUF1697 family)
MTADDSIQAQSPQLNYLALLRGINVGGKNSIKMDLLKQTFEENGFTEVQTYIQSGNILFNADENDKIKLREKIGKMVFDAFTVEINVLVLTLSDIENAVNNAPQGFGEENEKYKYDVIFLIEPLTKEEVIKELKPRENGDEFYEGQKVFYIKRLIKKLSGSFLEKIIKTPMWQNITIRNLKTTKKLYELMLERKENQG